MSLKGGISSWWPEKRKARQRVRDHVRRGKIEKPAVCSGCGEPHEPAHLAGHHAKYSKADSVRWLCHKCHTKANKRKGERVNQWR